MLMETCNITYKSSQTMKDLCTCKIKTCDELEDDNPAALPSLDLIISLVAAGNIQEKMLDVDG